MTILSYRWLKKKQNSFCIVFFISSFLSKRKKSKLWKMLIIVVAWTIYSNIVYFFFLHYTCHHVRKTEQKRKYFFITINPIASFSFIHLPILYFEMTISTANNSNIRQLEDHTKCPICFDTFQDPWLLLCSHTICFKCIRNWNYYWMLKKMNSLVDSSSTVVGSSTVLTSAFLQ
jgi:RING-type zinc-finger